MRIASLVPSATESLFALGMGEQVVGVTHECDWPPAARELPQLTRSEIPAGLGPAEIDAAVRELTQQGKAIYGLDADRLEQLRPDLIVTQALCAVCAVSFDDVRSVASSLPGEPDVLSLDPETLEEVLADQIRLAEACGVADRGERLDRDLRERLSSVSRAVDGSKAPGVVALEWLDPPFIGGHWIPEMIRIAGGADVLGQAGVKSRTATWQEIEGASARVILVMPCGLYADEAETQARERSGELARTGAEEIWAVDAASSFSRPGPRLVDGVELLAHLFHPERVPAPESLGYKPCDSHLETRRNRGVPRDNAACEQRHSEDHDRTDLD